MGMFGLHDKKEGPKLDLTFDLEKEMKNTPKEREQKLKEVEGLIREAKKLTVEPASAVGFQEAEVLLKGFTALKKVLDRVKK